MDYLDTVFVLVGVVLILAGMIFFIGGKHKGVQNKIEALGVKLDLNNPSLVFLAAGMVMILVPRMFPVLVPDSDPPAPRLKQEIVAGEYQLLEYREGQGTFQGVAYLDIFQLDPLTYRWRAQFFMDQPFQEQSNFNYQGRFRKGSNGWFYEVTGSDDPLWRDNGSVPMVLSVSKGRIRMSYKYDGEQVESVWSRKKMPSDIQDVGTKAELL